MGNTTTQDFIELSIKHPRQKVRINGDDNAILEINLSDMHTLSRLEDNYPKLNACIEKVKQLSDIDTTNDAGVQELTSKFKAIDDEMRTIVDDIFDANVCEVCVPTGSLYDPFEGQFRFEYLIDALSGLYETNLKSEFNKMKKRVDAKAKAVRASHNKRS